jgi:hypothetical protein
LEVLRTELQKAAWTSVQTACLSWCLFVSISTFGNSKKKKGLGLFSFFEHSTISSKCLVRLSSGSMYPTGFWIYARARFVCMCVCVCERESRLGTISKLITIPPYHLPSPFLNIGLHCI